MEQSEAKKRWGAVWSDVSVVVAVADFIEWRERSAVAYVCRAWNKGCCQQALWREVFHARHGCTTPIVDVISGRHEWFCKTVAADAFAQWYPTAVEADDLLNTTWQSHVLRVPALIDHIDSLRSRFALCEQSSGTFPALSAANNSITDLLKMAPFVDLWAVSSQDLAAFEATYVPKLSKVRLRSLRDCQSAILVTLQGVLYKAVGKMMQDTQVDLSAKSDLKNATFRDLINLSIPSHHQHYKTAWDELSSTVQLARDLTEVMSMDLMLPASSCISLDGAVETDIIKGFADKLEGVKDLLQPLKGKLLDFIVLPWEADLDEVMRSVNRLISVAAAVEQTKLYYMSEFIEHHYLDDAVAFKELWAVYVQWITGFEADDALYDVSLLRFGHGCLVKIRNDFEALDRKHVVTASLASPQCFFFRIEEVRHNLLRSPSLESIPSPLLHCVLPFMSNKPLKLTTVSTDKHSVSEVQCLSSGVSLGQPFYIAAGSEPLPEEFDQVLWSINGNKLDTSHSVATRCPPGHMLYNTAPLWVTQVSHAIRKELHRYLSLTCEADGDPDFAEIGRLQPIPAQVVTALWCTKQLQAAVSAPNTLPELKTKIESFLASCQDMSTKSDELHSFAASVLCYYLNVAEQLLKASSEMQQRVWYNTLKYILLSSPLGCSLNHVDVSIGGSSLRYGFSTLRGDMGSSFSMCSAGLEMILKRLCRQDNTVLCIETPQEDPEGRCGPLPLEIIVSGIASTLGRSSHIVDCSSLTEESLIRCFVASSATGWMLVLKGINNIPKELSEVLSSCLETLDVSHTNKWETVRWKGWPVAEMPTSLDIGYSVGPLVIASLEEGDPYHKGSTPIDYADLEALEAFLPWDIVRRLDMLWIPSEDMVPFVTAQMNEHGMGCRMDSVAALWQAITIEDTEAHSHSLQGSYLRIFRSLDSKTKHFIRNLMAMMADLLRPEPTCLRFIRMSKEENVQLETPVKPLVIVLSMSRPRATYHHRRAAVSINRRRHES